MSINNTVELYFADREDVIVETDANAIYLTVISHKNREDFELEHTFYLTTSPTKTNEYNSVTEAIRLIENAVNCASKNRRKIAQLLGYSY